MEIEHTDSTSSHVLHKCLPGVAKKSEQTNKDTAGQADGSLELVVGGDQHDFVRLSGALAVACLAILAGLHHLLCGLLGILLVGWGEVVDGILYYISRVHRLLEAARDALHGGVVVYETRREQHIKHHADTCTVLATDSVYTQRDHYSQCIYKKNPTQYYDDMQLC